MGPLNQLVTDTIPMLPAAGVACPLPIPGDSALCGAEVYAQAIHSDAGASAGVAFTPGLGITPGNRTRLPAATGSWSTQGAGVLPVLDSPHFALQSLGMLIALNELQVVLYPSLAGGCLVGGSLAWFAAARRRLLAILPLLLAAVIAVWFSLAAGMHFGYGAWQGIDNPPEEAFADGANLIGSVMFGWMPAGFFCGVVFVLARVLRQRRRSRAELLGGNGAAAASRGERGRA